MDFNSKYHQSNEEKVDDLDDRQCLSLFRMELLHSTASTIVSHLFYLFLVSWLLSYTGCPKKKSTMNNNNDDDIDNDNNYYNN